MILPDFHITQTDCNELIFKDTTPPYSPEYSGGYGALNVDADRITWASITIDLGKNGVYELSKDYNQTKGEWIIRASDIPAKETADSGCSDCGTPCGCEGCDDTRTIEKDCLGFLTAFPEGCITLRYEVFSDDLECSCRKSEGVKIKRIVSTCALDKKFAEVADKLTLGDSECYSFFNKKETRMQTMQKVALAWAKLKLLEKETDLDCDCIASRIKQTTEVLNSIQLP